MSDDQENKSVWEMMDAVGGGPAAEIATKIEERFGPSARAAFEAANEQIVFLNTSIIEPGPGRAERFLDWEFQRRIDALLAQWRSRKTKPRIEDDQFVRALYREAQDLKSKFPRMTWPQIAGHIGVSDSTLKRWRRRLENLPLE